MDRKALFARLRGRRLVWFSWLLSPLFVLLFSGGRPPAQATPFDPAAVDAFITRQMAAQRIPGLALAITLGSDVLYVQGYGSSGNGQPVTPETPFFIASVSKAFTALAVMQQVEAGRVDLDAPVQTYLPEFTPADPALARQITIRHLLNQTSGLSEITFADLQLPQPETIAERVTSLRSARPVAPPGDEYHYFSPNYGVLARVVEVVSGQAFTDYLEEHVFSPLAMDRTRSVITSAEAKQTISDLAQGHLVVFGIPFAYPEMDGYLGGSGGIVTSAGDLAHFLIAQLNGGRYQGQALVPPESLGLMHTPPAGTETTYAMGWTEITIAGRPALEHNGILSTFLADAVLLPEEEIGIALLFNVNSTATSAFGLPAIRNGLVDLLSGRPAQAGPLTVAAWGWLTAGLTVIGGLLAVRSLIRLPGWAQRARAIPGWRLVPGIVWAFVPAFMLLVGIPALTARFAGRVFGFVNLYKSMLGIFAWLALTGLLGAVNGVARIVILARRSRKPRS